MTQRINQLLLIWKTNLALAFPCSQDHPGHTAWSSAANSISQLLNHGNVALLHRKRWRVHTAPYGKGSYVFVYNPCGKHLQPFHLVYSAAVNSQKTLILLSIIMYYNHINHKTYILLGNKQGFVFYAVVWLSTQRSSAESYENRIFYYRYFLQGRAKSKEKKKAAVGEEKRCTKKQRYSGKRLIFLGAFSLREVFDHSASFV